MQRRNPNASLGIFWVKIRQRGYARSISGLYRFLRKRGQIAVKLPNPKYIPKPDEQKVQSGVKFVPAFCLAGNTAGEGRETGDYYQYTFIDEYSSFPHT